MYTGASMVAIIDFILLEVLVVEDAVDSSMIVVRISETFEMLVETLAMMKSVDNYRTLIKSQSR